VGAREQVLGVGVPEAAAHLGQGLRFLRQQADGQDHAALLADAAASNRSTAAGSKSSATTRMKYRNTS